MNTFKQTLLGSQTMLHAFLHSLLTVLGHSNRNGLQFIDYIFLNVFYCSTIGSFEMTLFIWEQKGQMNKKVEDFTGIFVYTTRLLVYWECSLTRCTVSWCSIQLSLMTGITWLILLPFHKEFLPAWQTLTTEHDYSDIIERLQKRVVL